MGFARGESGAPSRIGCKIGIAILVPSNLRRTTSDEEYRVKVKHSGPKSGERIRDAQEGFQHTVELAKKAEEWGYHRFWVAEHHGSTGVVGSSPEVLVSHLLAKTNHIRVGSGGVMLQHYSPYKVAENFNVLASLAPEEWTWELAGDQAACPTRPERCNRRQGMKETAFRETG